LNQDSNLLPRSRVAIDKLERAVQRLEGAMGRPGGDLFARPERVTSTDEYERLDQTTRLVEARLDAVIDRLKTILED
jgi:hypothetical protein